MSIQYNSFASVSNYETYTIVYKTHGYAEQFINILNTLACHYFWWKNDIFIETTMVKILVKKFRPPNKSSARRDLSEYTKMLTIFGWGGANVKSIQINFIGPTPGIVQKWDLKNVIVQIYINIKWLKTLDLFYGKIISTKY